MEWDETRIGDAIRCGECGESHFTVYNLRKPSEHTMGGGGTPYNEVSAVTFIAGKLILKCTKCGGQSVISVSASLTLNGHATGGWRKP